MIKHFVEHQDHYYLGADDDDVPNDGLVDGAALLLVPGLDEVCPSHLVPPL